MKRAIAVAVAVAAAGIAVGFYIVGFLLSAPSTVPAASTSSGAHLTLQTVGAYGHDPTADWVSYLAQDPSGNWVHSTYIHVPAYTTVTVTIYQYDSASGLRDPLWAQPRGVTGGVINVDGKTVTALDPGDPGHSFTVPDLGVSVPLKGIPDDAKNPCPAAPCTTDFDHTTTTFSFYTGAPGEHRWQCFVPCAASFYFGWGGPMQTLGYMDGELIVS